MRFKTADLCDAHSEKIQILSPGLLSYGGKPQFYGRIVTLKLFEDNSLLRDLLGDTGDGRVIVVDGGGSQRCALLGDMLASKAVQNGWGGLVINGCIRDSAEINEMNIGIRALGTHPLKSLKKGVGEKNLPVHFACVEFRPGDYLYADEDGILVAQDSLLPDPGMQL
jgi:regulator of ribonuclease activity A